LKNREEITLNKVITTLSIILLSVILFCVGSFFTYVGAWNYVLGSRIGLFLGPFIALGGGCIIFLGINAIMRMQGVRNWIIALGATSLYGSSFFLYFGLRVYFFPRFPGDIYNAQLGLNLGSTTAIMGILLILIGIVFQKRKRTINC